MHGDGDADTGIRARELLEDEDVREEVGAAPPSSAGTQTPISPSSASFSYNSVGKRCSRSQTAAFGSISACATSRASA
jgi:hypothetical protein